MPSFNEKNFWKSKILDFLKKNPNNFFGACKISNALDIPEEIRKWNSWGTHTLCLELLAESKVKQSMGHGFKYNKH